MAGHNYICEIGNLDGFVGQMEELCEGTNTEFHFKGEIVRELQRREWKRIRWFYYCDQQDGNTIRLYDREFFARFKHLYWAQGDYVILRGNELGTPYDKVKVTIRDELPHLKLSRSGLTSCSPEERLRFFGILNRCPRDLMTHSLGE